ncbi:hypothetical protein, partial [Herbaspirillum rubrisubalbicans]|uniref:hypothetical protein n=1 Tax=Herbaspirillum rubrisubalbicans TaxID=80842 RepID=UPI001C1313B4
GFTQYPHNLFIAVSTLFHGFLSDWKLSSQIFSGPKNSGQVNSPLPESIYVAADDVLFWPIADI